MKLAYILVGVLIVSIGIVLSGFSLPWVAWNYLPHLIELRPFAAVAIFLYIIGGILLALGFTENLPLRIFLVVVVIATVFLLTQARLPFITL